MPLLMINKRGVNANSWLLPISQKKDTFLIFVCYGYTIVRMKVGQPNLQTELYSYITLLKKVELTCLVDFMRFCQL